MKTMFMGGAHRGGMAITESALGLSDIPSCYNTVIIADPKENRANTLAQVWRNRGVSSDGLKEPCEKAVMEADPDAVVLAIDTISPMAEILDKTQMPTQWQLLARGLGADGPLVGIAGTVTDGDAVNRASSIQLIKELGGFIQPHSSTGIRSNPLNADGLHVMRKKVSEHSVRRLGVLDREPIDIVGGALNLLWGTCTYPMVVQEKPSEQGWRYTKQQVLEAELPTCFSNTSAYAVATVGHQNMDFFVVDEARGRRSVRFHMPLVHSLPAEANLHNSSYGVKTAKASSIALMAIAAPFMAMAMVTD